MIRDLRLLIPLVLLLVLPLLVAAQERPVPIAVTDNMLLGDDVILAEYEDGIITRQELDERIEKIPPNQRGAYLTVAGQTQVLDVIALEKVLMLKAIQLGIDQEPDVKEKVEAATRQFYIQEYYKRNVIDMVVITEADKMQYFENNPQLFAVLPVVNINYMQVEDEVQGMQALTLLQEGEIWADVSEIYNKNSYVKGLKGVIKNIRLNGNIPGIGNDFELEDLIRQNTANIDKIIGPIETDSGWHLISVTQFNEGRSKQYSEVVPEIEQRLRPLKEKELLDELRSRLMDKFGVQIETSLFDRIDLNSPTLDEDIADEYLVTSTHDQFNYTVSKIIENFHKLSPQEQIMYIKGEGVSQLVDQELIRDLMFTEATQQGYAKYVETNDDYVQMKTYYILNTTFRRLVVDAVTVSDEEVQTYYDAHLGDYTTPASRAIQVLWFETEKDANRTLNKYSRMHRLGDEKNMQKIIEAESLRPNQSVLDNQYDNGIITGIGSDEAFSRKIWDNPVGYLSPVFKTARGDFAFFNILRENPAVIKTLTEMEPRIFGILKREKETIRQEDMSDELAAEFNLIKYPERLRLLLSAEELFNMADDAARMRRFKDAINSYDQIIQNYQNGVDDYKASFMKAFLVAEELKNTELAIDLFKTFLRKFPTGDLNESAQFMIDSLEGNIELNIDDELLEFEQD